MDGSDAARRFLIRGRVQGVGFRWFVTRAAERLGVAGWTRNLPDGRVEVLAQGGVEAMRALASELRTGPRAARVDAIDTIEVSPDASLRGFDVRD